MKKYEGGNVYGMFSNTYNLPDGSTSIFCYCFRRAAAPFPKEILPSTRCFCPDLMESEAFKSKIKEVETISAV